MHQDDVWQVYAGNGEPIKGCGWDAAKDNPTKDDKEICAAAVVWLYRRTPAGLECLWQRRAEGVKNGGLWDFSAGGHCNVGETFAEAAVREAREEIGVKIEPQDLHFILTRAWNKKGGFLKVLYLVDWTDKPEDFHFDDGEVAELRWIPFRDTTDFRHQYAKPSVAEDEATFLLISEWLENEGLV